MNGNNLEISHHPDPKQTVSLFLPIHNLGPERLALQRGCAGLWLADSLKSCLRSPQRLRTQAPPYLHEVHQGWRLSKSHSLSAWDKRPPSHQADACLPILQAPCTVRSPVSLSTAAGTLGLPPCIFSGFIRKRISRLWSRTQPTSASARKISNLTSAEGRSGVYSRRYGRRTGLKLVHP